MTAQTLFPVPDMSPDPRVRVFRRVFDAPGEFEGMEVDAYVVITDRYLVVLDTLLCPEDMATLMQLVQAEQAGRQLLVVNSHADWDHAWGNNYFTVERAAPIISHAHGVTRLRSDEAHTELADIQQRYPLFQQVVLTPATLTFTQQFTIYGGDLTLHLLAAPGHHSDHIAAWLPELRLLLAFDAVESPLPIIEQAQATPAMFATLQHFLSLDPQHVLCSHGKTTGIETVKRNLAYLQEIEQRSRILLNTHTPTDAELEHAATLIQYPFEEVIANIKGSFDHAFYSWAHDSNVRCIVQWLMQEGSD